MGAHDVRPEEPVEVGAIDETTDLIQCFKKDVDRTLLIENLKLTVAERMEKFEANMEMMYELRRAGQRMRERERQKREGR
jgi:hypothetical protein